MLPDTLFYGLPHSRTFAVPDERLFPAPPHLSTFWVRSALIQPRCCSRASDS